MTSSISSKHDGNPEGVVTRQECAQISSGVKDELKTIKEALVGRDMRGGLVRDVAELKKERSISMQVLRTVIVPIVIAVIVAIIITRF